MKTILNEKVENHILPLFWQSEENRDSVTEYMHKINQAGIGAVCVESRTFEGFCEDTWWQHMDTIMSLARELGMRVWLLDDKHFPTGYANGLIEKKYPERRKWVLNYRKIDVFGTNANTGYYSKALHDDTAKLYAVIAIQGDCRIDITGAVADDQVLYYDFPEGMWSVYFIYTSNKVDVSPFDINMVDKESCDVLLEAVYEPHYLRYKDDFGKTFAGFFSDEPGFYNEDRHKGQSPIGKDMPLPWSKETEKRLLERLGDDFKTFLPELWRKGHGKTVETRYAYMDIVTQLYQENFSDNLGNWCRSHGCEYIGHVIEERHSNARLGCGAGHMFRAMSGKDMAGLDIIFNQLTPEMDGEHCWFNGIWDGEFFHYALGKLGTSLAHIDPKKHGNTMLEIFGAYGWHTGLTLMKWLTDHFLSRGVNYFSPHAFSCSPFPDKDCPPHFYAHGHNPQYRYLKKLMDYTNEMSSLFSSGITKPSAAILYNPESEWVGAFELPQKAAKILTQNQIDFDFLCNDVFENPEAFDGDLSEGLVVNKTKYQVLIIPYCQYISKALAQFIADVRERDVKIICMKALPEGLFDTDEWSVLGKLEHVAVLGGEELYSYLNDNNMFRVKQKSVESYLRYHHYFKGNREYIMLFNEATTHTVEVDLEYPTDKKLYRVDVMEHRAERISQIKFPLKPYESCVVMIGEMDTGEADIVMVSEQGSNTMSEILQIQEPLRVLLADAKQYPDFTEYRVLEKPVNLARSEYLPKFTGTIRYETEVTLKTDLTYAVIDLGEVYEAAQVWINNQDLGVKICPPYLFIADDILKCGQNHIVVEITNTLDKQVYDMVSTAEPRRPSGLTENIKIESYGIRMEEFT